MSDEKNQNPLDVPGTAFEIELMFPNLSSSKRGNKPPMRRISFEVDDRIYDTFMAAQTSNLRLVGYMSVLPDTDEQAAHDAIKEKLKKVRKAKEPKGPFSQIWKWLFLWGFANMPGVKETVEEVRFTEAEDPWKVLHRIFGVEGGTLAMISPEQIDEKFPPNEYPKVKAMVDRAREKAIETPRIINLDKVDHDAIAFYQEDHDDGPDDLPTGDIYALN